MSSGWAHGSFYRQGPYERVPQERDVFTETQMMRQRQMNEGAGTSLICPITAPKASVARKVKDSVHDWREVGISQTK